MPTKKVKVNLYGRNAPASTEVTAQGFPTRHVRLPAPERTHKSESAKITPNPPTHAEQVKAVMPAFNSAWKENRQRVIDFLSEGFFGNLSEGVILKTLADAITEQYNTREKMTAAQWTALTADLQQEKWSWGDWIHVLKQTIWKKYEGRRYMHLATYPDFTPPADESGEPAKVFIDIHNSLDPDYPKKQLWEGTKAKTFETYCQAYANENDITIRVETEQGRIVKWFMHEQHYREIRGGCTRCGHPACDGVSSTGIRCSG